MSQVCLPTAQIMEIQSKILLAVPLIFTVVIGMIVVAPKEYSAYMYVLAGLSRVFTTIVFGHKAVTIIQCALQITIMVLQFISLLLWIILSTLLYKYEE